MEFISGAKALETIAPILRAERQQIAIAVAFWGSDAKRLLEIDKWQASSIQVICDATSGACNPNALRYLQDKIGGNLFTNPRLHAKVYWTPKCALVTSANASANGLSLQDGEQAANIEAGVILHSPDILLKVKQWFDQSLKLPDTAVVDNSVLDEATRMWKLRRTTRRTVAASLLDALMDKEIIADRNIVVCNYEDEERSREGKVQHFALKDEWERGSLKAPVSIEKTVEFTSVDDYEELQSSLKHYPWES
jgi:PLD-like domain